MASVENKISCFKASAQLKGTQTYINEDVSKDTLEIRRQGLDFSNLKRREGFKGNFSGIEVVWKRWTNRPLANNTFQSNAGDVTSDGPSGETGSVATGATADATVGVTAAVTADETRSEFFAPTNGVTLGMTVGATADATSVAIARTTTAATAGTANAMTTVSATGSANAGARPKTSTSGGRGGKRSPAAPCWLL